MDEQHKKFPSQMNGLFSVLVHVGTVTQPAFDRIDNYYMTTSDRIRRRVII